MTEYHRALQLLGQALVFGIEPSLAGIRALAQQLGDPQLSYPSIQIAGTNGKSSTARFTAAFLHSQGYRVGLYTSPELVAYPERIEINGAVISEQRFGQAVLAAHVAAEAAIAAGDIQLVTEFELLTAAALWLYREEQVDFAVLEVGLGGRWDATSVVSPRVAAVTGIDLDHTAILGDTIQQIAAEKAAIIKPGSVAVLGLGIPDGCREVFTDAIARAGGADGSADGAGRVPARASGRAGQPARASGRVGQPAQSARTDDTGQPAQAGGGGPMQEDVGPYWELLQGLDSSRFPRYQQQNIACALAVTAAALKNAAVPARLGFAQPQQAPPRQPSAQQPRQPQQPWQPQQPQPRQTSAHQAPPQQPRQPQPIDLKAIQGVLDELHIPGRFEVVRQQPLLMIDASHNPQSAQVLAAALAEAYGLNGAGRLNGFDSLLLGILADKDAAGIIAVLTPLFDKLIVTQSQSPRAIPASQLAQLVYQVDGRQPQVFSSVAEALAAITAATATTVATGSITLAGEVAANIGR